MRDKYNVPDARHDARDISSDLLEHTQTAYEIAAGFPLMNIQEHIDASLRITYDPKWGAGR